MQRALDVLDLVTAAVDEIDADAAVHMLVNAVRDRHAARIGEPLDTGGHIDAVAVEVAALDHDVAEIDADAQHDAPICGMSSFAAAMAFCSSAAHSTALTALPNSTSTPSPIP